MMLYVVVDVIVLVVVGVVVIVIFTIVGVFLCDSIPFHTIPFDSI